MQISSILRQNFRCDGNFTKTTWVLLGKVRHFSKIIVILKQTVKIGCFIV